MLKDIKLTKKKIILRFLFLKINQGYYKIGQKMPSEKQLSIKFFCNRHTVSSVYKELVSFGIVKFIAGKGFFLLNNYEKMISSKNFLYFNSTSNNKISKDELPLKVLNKYNINYNLLTCKEKLFCNGKLIGIRFYIINAPSFLLKNMNTKINVKSLLKDLSFLGLPIFRLNQSIKFSKNKNWELKDKYIIESYISLKDDENKECVFIFSLYSATRSNFHF